MKRNIRKKDVKLSVPSIEHCHQRIWRPLVEVNPPYIKNLTSSNLFMLRQMWDLKMFECFHYYHYAAHHLEHFRVI